MTITTRSPCSTFPSGNYSPGLQIFLTIHVSIVLRSLTTALSWVFILTDLSTRLIIRAIPLIVIWRSAVVIGLKICEYEPPWPGVAQASLFFGISHSRCLSSPLFIHIVYLVGYFNHYLQWQLTLFVVFRTFESIRFAMDLWAAITSS